MFLFFILTLQQGVFFLLLLFYFIFFLQKCSGSRVCISDQFHQGVFQPLVSCYLLLKTNIAIVCPALFLLSHCNVFSTLIVDTWLLCCLRRRSPAGLCLIWVFGLALFLQLIRAAVFSQTAFDMQDPITCRVELKVQGSSEVKLPEGEVRAEKRREYKEVSSRWRKVKTPLKKSPQLIFLLIPCAQTGAKLIWPFLINKSGPTSLLSVRNLDCRLGSI